MILSVLLTANLTQNVSLSEARRREIVEIIPSFESANSAALIQAALTGPATKPSKDRGYDEFYVGNLRVAFFRGSNSIAFCLGDQNPSWAPTKQLTDAELKSKVLNTVSKLHSLPQDTLKLTVTRSGPIDPQGQIEVDVTPMIGDRTSDNGALFIFDGRSGHLMTFRVDKPLDHSRYRNSPIITEAQALLSALDAYSRWRPFESGQIKYGPLLRSGTQNPGSGGDFATEVTQAIQEEWKSGKARPYWLVQFNSGVATSSFQRVCVDGISGRSLVIETFTSLGTKPFTATRLQATEKIGIAGFKGTVKRVSDHVVSGPSVVVRRGKDVYLAQFDHAHNIISLPTGKTHVSYATTKEFAGSLHSRIVANRELGIFGSRKPK